MGIFITFSCFVGLLKNGDYFIKLHAIKISNIYGLSLISIGLSMLDFDWLIFMQTFLIIILNVLITITISHVLTRFALNNNIKHKGISRRDYKKMREK
jgi:monovalent cation/proton antiporter MnhG/PhaG subunit